MSYNSDYNSPLKPSAAGAVAVSPPTPTTHPSSDGNSTTSHQSQTPGSIDDNGPTPPPLKLNPPPPRPRPRPPASKSTREDCWSEDATFTLIEAWGERILKLNSGSLRQKHWLEVADAVNARHGHVKKARRSDVQCKNRIDTLKKKYKVEKALVSELGSDRYVSPWPFFAPLDSLLGSNFKPTTQPKRKRIPPPPALPPPPSSVPVGRRSKRPQPPTDSSVFRRNFSVMAAAAAAIDGADSDSDSHTSLSLSSGGNRNQNQNQNRNWNWNGNGNGKGGGPRVEKKEDETGCDPYRQLAEAIGKFADVYKRVEEAKQRQMVELEKQRMQFTKDLELERMKLLMESQVQLRSLKRLKSNSEPDLCRSDDSASVS